MWTVVAFTDTGRAFDIWSTETRRAAREALARYRAAHPNLRMRIARRASS